MAYRAKTILDLVIGTITRGREAGKEIERITSEATAKGVAQGMFTGSKETERKLGETFRNLGRTGMTAAAKVLREGVEDASRKQQALLREQAAYQRQLARARDDEQRQRIKAKQIAVDQELKKERKAQEKLISQAEKAAEKRVELLEAAEKKRARSGIEKTSDRSEGFGKLLEGGFEIDSSSAKGFAETLMKAVSGGLESAAGGIMASGAASEGGMLAGLVGGLTAAAATIAAVAAGVVAVVGVFAMAYNQTKEMNKSIMDNVSAIDLNAASSENLATSLKEVRGAALNNAYSFRVANAEVIGAITAFHEAGVTLGEMQGFAKGARSQMQAYTQISAMAIVASEGLNIAVSDVAEFANTLSRDLGGSLDSVQSAFDMIGDQAKRAGMNTKDFFTAINGATSGMALYNFRMQDTVGLYTDLVKIMGEDLANQSLALDKTFRNMGTQERYKSRILMGGGTQDKIAKADAQAQAKQFTATFGDEFKNLGIFTGEGEDRTLDLDKLAKMQGKEFTTLYSKLQARDPAAARQISDVRNLARGGVSAMGSASKAGELAMQLSQGKALRGGKMLGDMTGMGRAMMEEAIGVSGEEYDKLAQLELGLKAKYEAKGGKEGFGGKDFEEALASGELLTGPELEKAMEEQGSSMEILARKSLKETTSISQTLSTIIAKALEEIGGWLEMLVTYFGKAEGIGEDAIAARSKSLQAERELLADAEAGREQLATERAELARMKPGEERNEKRHSLIAVEARTEAKEKAAARESTFQRELASLGSIGGAFGASIDPEQMKSLYPQLKEMGLTRTLEKDFIKKNPVTGEDEVLKAGTEVADLANLTDEQKEILSRQLEIQEEEALTDSKNAELQRTIDKEGFEDVVAQLQNAAKEQGSLDLAGLTSMEAVTKGITNNDWDDVIAAIKADKKVTEEERKALSAAGVPSKLWPALGPVDDFIYRGDGVSGDITPINKMDEFFGAKPGGAIHQAVGGGKNVNIYINGGDTEKIRSVVTKVLKDTGYADLKSY